MADSLNGNVNQLSFSIFLNKIPGFLILKSIFKNCNVIGADINELAPKHNLYACDFLSAKLIYKTRGIFPLVFSITLNLISKNRYN